MDKIIFHIDVNSAYLSWSALEELSKGGNTDLRDIPSIIGGDIEKRHGVVLAKSIPAKAFGIVTGEPIVNAFRKCPHLVLHPPDHSLYHRRSEHLMEFLSDICPDIEQVSVDECYMDYTPIAHRFSSPTAAAAEIRAHVRQSLGFTVNIGISSAKVLAKMASDFEKPDKTHTLFPEELEEKLWPLPVRELFSVGGSTAARLTALGIRTIGDLAGRRTMEKVPPARRLILLIVAGTLPLFLILPIKDAVEGLYANTFFVGGALLVTGLLLYFCDRLRKGRKNERSASIVDVLIVGLGQAVATCPGISRSGMTISMGCFRGFERRFAVRFAFLLSIPAVLGANILQLKDVAETGVDLALLPAYLVGVAAAALSGYLSIRLVRMVADKGKFGSFAYYCWIAGVVTVVLSLLKALNLLPWLAA